MHQANQHRVCLKLPTQPSPGELDIVKVKAKGKNRGTKDEGMNSLRSNQQHNTPHHTDNHARSLACSVDGRKRSEICIDLSLLCLVCRAKTCNAMALMNVIVVAVVAAVAFSLPFVFSVFFFSIRPKQVSFIHSFASLPPSSHSLQIPLQMDPSLFQLTQL